MFAGSSLRLFCSTGDVAGHCDVIRGRPAVSGGHTLQPSLACVASWNTHFHRSFPPTRSGRFTIVAMVAFAIALVFTGDRATQFARLKPLLIWFVGGITIIAVPLFVLWWRLGAIPEMFRQLVVFPFATYRKTSALPFPRFGGAKSAFDTAVVSLFYLPAVVQIIGLIYLVQAMARRRFGFGEAALLFLLTWSGLFYLQVWSGRTRVICY
jgi:hypothetical protein